MIEKFAEVHSGSEWLRIVQKYDVGGQCGGIGKVDLDGIEFLEGVLRFVGQEGANAHATISVKKMGRT